MHELTATNIAESLQSIAKSLERATTPLNTLRAPVLLSEEPTFLEYPGKKLAGSLAYAVITELESGPEDLRLAIQLSEEGWNKIRATVKKYAERYFANAQDTSDKLAQAYGELSQLRKKSNSDFRQGLERAAGIVEAHTGPGKTLDAIRELIRLNTPTGEEISA
jgi:hypothetical protein